MKRALIMARSGVVRERGQWQRRYRRVPRRVMDLDEFPSFEKKLKWKNQHHDTARRGHCELCIPKHFARENGIEKHRPLKFVSRSLIEDGMNTGRQQYLRMRFRDPDRNNGNFVIRRGWRTFSRFHDIKKNWRLNFTLTEPDQIYVRRMKLINGDSIPVRL